VIKKLLLGVGIAAVFSAQIFASGFQINEHGARAMAMGGAFAGLANDPSAIFFNPAGIAQLNGTHFMAGVTLISPKASFRGPAPQITEYDMQHQLFNPINFYFTQQVSKNLYFGLSVNNPYGLGSKWQPDWVGRYLAYNTSVETFFFTPVVAYKFSDKLMVSAGLTYATGKVTIERYVSLAPFEGDLLISMKGNGTAIGFTGGILWKATDQLSVGLSYRSQSKFDFSGTADADVPVALKGQIPTGDISASLTTPQNITVGLAYEFSKKLRVTADYQYVGWSCYDSLSVEFTESKIKSSTPRMYNNSFIARVGAEYNLSDAFALRGGLYYDKNPVPDEYVEPSLPDADRLGFNIGVGYNITKNIRVDLAYMFIRFNERKIEDSKVEYTNGSSKFNGVYNSSAHLFGVDFSYNF
jgi:long-chain fatty acid transport protein